MTGTAIASFILSLGVIVVLALAVWQRIKLEKGIGWQFIRFAVLILALPIVGVLALNGALTGEAATIIGSALGYAFGKTSES